MLNPEERECLNQSANAFNAYVWPIIRAEYPMIQYYRDAVLVPVEARDPEDSLKDEELFPAIKSFLNIHGVPNFWYHQSWRLEPVLDRDRRIDAFIVLDGIYVIPIACRTFVSFEGDGAYPWRRELYTGFSLRGNEFEHLRNAYTNKRPQTLVPSLLVQATFLEDKLTAPALISIGDTKCVVRAIARHEEDKEVVRKVGHFEKSIAFDNVADSSDVAGNARCWEKLNFNVAPGSAFVCAYGKSDRKTIEKFNRFLPGECTIQADRT